MAATKKLLVAFDPTKPIASSSDFLIPWDRDGDRVFLGLKSKSQHPLGVMIFLGRQITEKDLFAKLVDSHTTVSSIEVTLASLQFYLEQLRDFKIGNVLKPMETGERGGVELVANTPSAAARDWRRSSG